MNRLKIILNSINSNGKAIAFFLAALYCLSFQSAAAQQTPLPEKKPLPKTKTTSPTIVTPKPGTTAPTVITPNPRPLPTPPRETKRVVVNEGYTAAEKAIQTESKVTINLCVIEGSVRINGWDRDEVRAYVGAGSQVGFKIVQERNKKPVWVSVLGFDPKNNKEVKPEDCLSGSDIELDVPRNATINLESGESQIKIESVARVAVKTLSGGIYLNDIAYGIEATTYEGDLMVEKSSGRITLNNTSGNIIALDAAPSDVGDIFKAKTNSGRITLKGIEHRVIETGTISGSTTFDGELLSGGQYTFTTQNGSIILAVPPDSACKITAWFGFGAFNSEIPLVNTLKKEQSLTAQLGSGEATCNVNLKTGSGVIRIRKQGSENRAPENKEKDKSDKEKPAKPVSLKLIDDSCLIPALTVDLNFIFDVVFTQPRDAMQIDKKPQ